MGLAILNCAYNQHRGDETMKLHTESTSTLVSLPLSDLKLTFRVLDMTILSALILFPKLLPFLQTPLGSLMIHAPILIILGILSYHFKHCFLL